MVQFRCRLFILASLAVIGTAAFDKVQDFQVDDEHLGHVRLSVGISGDLSKRKVILVHGFPENADVWDPIAEELKAEFGVVAPNQRGYYPSEAPPSEGTAWTVNNPSFTIGKLVADLRSVISSVTKDGEKVLLVAHDFGGLVSWVYAHTYPESLAGFVVMNCPNPTKIEHLFATNEEQRTAAKYVSMFVQTPWVAEKALGSFSYKGAKATYAGKLEPGSALETSLVETWSTLRSQIDWYYQHATLSWFDMSTFKWQGYPEKVTVDVPTLFIWGEKDPMYIMENAKGLDEFVAKENLTVKLYPDSEHFPNVDNHEEVVADVKAFAAKVFA